MHCSFQGEIKINLCSRQTKPCLQPWRTVFLCHRACWEHAQSVPESRFAKVNKEQTVRGRQCGDVRLSSSEALRVSVVQREFHIPYLYVEWNADEDIPTYGDDDSQEIVLCKQTVNKQIRQSSIWQTTPPHSRNTPWKSHLQLSQPSAPWQPQEVVLHWGFCLKGVSVRSPLNWGFGGVSIYIIFLQPPHHRHTPNYKQEKHTTKRHLTHLKNTNTPFP